MIILSKSNISRISYPYNSAFMKLFASFDKSVITFCQCYYGHLPLNYLVDLRALKFYDKLSVSDFNPASILYRWFGCREHNDTAEKYSITTSDLVGCYGYKIRKSLSDYART